MRIRLIIKDLSGSVARLACIVSILIGMSFSDVIASRGRPHKRNKTTGIWGVHEQWIMHATSDSGKWDWKADEYDLIYFENGKVTSWQSR